MLSYRLFSLAALLFCSACLANDNNHNQTLNELKTKIDTQKKLLKTQKQQQQRLTNLLKATDKKIATAANKLFKTSNTLKQTRVKQNELQKEKSELLIIQKKQQEILAKQLKSAYMTGNNDLAQLLLNQQQSSKTERLLGYYQYLNDARLNALTHLKETFIQLQTIEMQLVDNINDLNLLIKTQKKEQSTLKQRKETRKNALAQLKKSYQKNSTQLEQYQLSELDIKQLITATEDKPQKTLPLNGLKRLKGRLLKPTTGKPIHKFGQKRNGQLRWKGMTFSGKEGQAINAIHHGTVVYSDWIKGFGLVIVLDHGEGYMSLYGHNQALLKNIGDFVDAKEQIALLGQSGGQEKPVLYFEIREKGKAINPQHWLKK